MPTGENPFFNRGPIFDPAHFFGREREQRQVMGLLKNMQNVSVVGQPKTGKTSLLLHLARPETQLAHGLDPATYILALLNLEGTSNLTPERFFHWVLRETERQGQQRAIRASLPALEPEGTISFPRFQEALGAAGARLVFLMDEFDLAAANERFDLNFFSALRAVASTPHVALVTATESPLYELIPTDRQVGSPLSNLFTTIRLGRMDRDEVSRLVGTLSASSGVALDSHLDFILKVTGGWPYGVQLLCSVLWERLAAEDLMAMGPLSRTADGWRIHAVALARFASDRAAEERAQADKFLAVDQADQRPTDQVALPEDKHSIYSVVRALVKATEARNPYARGHTDSTTRYAVAIAQELSLPADEIEGLKVASRLHDIGHIGVSDLVLLKPGQLTPNETELVHAHVLVSVHILEALEFPWTVKPIVRSHHERWDGSGYPDGLITEEIPLGARILAVADVAAAMTAARPWRPALPLAEAVAEVKSHAGTKYDPQVVQAFLHVIERLPPGASAPPREDRRRNKAHGHDQA